LTGDTEVFEALRETVDSAGIEELDQRLWAAIAQLSESAAQIVILRYIQNCSIEEIAKLVGTTCSTVAVSLFRSRAKLKKLIRASQSGGDS
jgi:RNA polymerase sigma factor (sigma-70 family)